MPVEYFLQRDDNEYVLLYLLWSGNMYARLCVQRLKKKKKINHSCCKKWEFILLEQ